MPLHADGIIIEYDKDRENRKFIPEAPVKPLVSPSHPQSDCQSSDLDPPSLPMFREGGLLTESRINWISSLLRPHPANAVLMSPKQKSEKWQKSHEESLKGVETERR